MTYWENVLVAALFSFETHSGVYDQETSLYRADAFPAWLIAFVASNLFLAIAWSILARLLQPNEDKARLRCTPPRR